MGGPSLPYLLNRAAAVVSLAVLVSGLWFVADGLQDLPRSGGWVALGGLLVGLSIFGRIPVLKLFPAAPPARATQPGRPDAIVGAGGGQLHVERHGPADGWPVVLVQGFETDRTLWAPMLGALAERYHVLTWDPPGIGLSERPYDDVYSLERIAADLGSVLKLLEGKPALVVGWGGGAAAVLAHARAHPECLGAEVAGAVLLNPITGPAASGALVQADMLLSPLVQVMNWTGYLNGSLHLAARSTALGQAPSRAAAETAARLAAEASPWVQAKAALALHGADLTGAAERLSVPVLIVAGGCDLQAPPDAVRRLAEAVPGAEFATVEGAGHAGPLEFPEAYGATVSAFARRVFERLEQLARPRHADVLRRPPPLYDLGHEPHSFAAEADVEPLPPEEEWEERMRSLGDMRPAGRA